MVKGKPGSKFILKPQDISFATTGSRAGGSASAKVSRAASTRSLTVIIRHEPTGLEIQGEIPEARYTKKQMLAAQRDQEQKLFEKLTERVAKHLKIPGR